MEEEYKQLCEELDNLLAHAEDEQTVTKLRSRLSDKSSRYMMFKRLSSGIFREFVVSHKPLSDYVDVLSCILDFMCEYTEQFDSLSEIRENSHIFWDSVHALRPYFMTSPELYELLWTKPPSISLVNELSTLLLAMSPVLRDCHVTCGDISPHPFITFPTNTLAQVFSVLSSNHRMPMQSKAVCCTAILLFSRCSEPTQASDFELFFKTQTGLEAEDMDTLCRTTIHPSFLKLPCFATANLGNDDLTFRTLPTE